MKLLSDIMLEALKFFAYFGGYGWGIVWLTIAVNLALYPLTLASIKSMGAMQKIQPRIQELQKKLKEKPQELQKETMDLYKSEGINPLGGCLPMILKIPFFIALFWAFQSTAFFGIASSPNNNTGILWINGRVSEKSFQTDTLVRKLESSKVIVLDSRMSQRAGVNFYVWDAVREVGEKNLRDVLRGASEKKVEDVERIRDALTGVVGTLDSKESAEIISAWRSTNSLAKPDRVNTPFGKISLLALLIGITTFLMQKTMPGAGNQQTQMMTMFMPLFITFICWNFPAGVQLYWLVANGVGAAQQYYIMRQKPAHKKRAKEE